jgi:hypothetical protein
MFHLLVRITAAKRMLTRGRYAADAARPVDPIDGTILRLSRRPDQRLTHSTRHGKVGPQQPPRRDAGAPFFCLAHCASTKGCTPEPPNGAPYMGV